MSKSQHGTFIFMCYKLSNCWLVEALLQARKLVTNFERNTIQTTVFTKLYTRQIEAQGTMKNLGHVLLQSDTGCAIYFHIGITLQMPVMTCALFVPTSLLRGVLFCINKTLVIKSWWYKHYVWSGGIAITISLTYKLFIYVCIYFTFTNKYCSLVGLKPINEPIKHEQENTLSKHIDCHFPIMKSGAL